VRAFISNGLQENLPFKVFYQGPAFRYERPQKGRLRQFHQVGAELLGPTEPTGDIEMIAMAAQMLAALGLRDHVTLELNSLGDGESRAAFRDALVAYFSDHRALLSEDSKTRLDKNPLRILDSKDEGDHKLIANAPNLHAHFTPLSADFYAEVKASLTALGIAFTENPRLVRGLDYYSHTVFEFTTDKLGAQGTVLAGGRYDGLVKLMGGHDIAGVGFAAGIERLLALIEAVGAPLHMPFIPRIAVIPVGEAEEKTALLLTQHLRTENISAELITRGNIGKKMKRAEKFAVSHVVILGEEEVASGQFTVKNMATGEQQKLTKAALVATFQQAAS
jgi:histidyl-tRNA synthetase